MVSLALVFRHFDGRKLRARGVRVIKAVSLTFDRLVLRSLSGTVKCKQPGGKLLTRLHKSDLSLWSHHKVSVAASYPQV